MNSAPKHWKTVVKKFNLKRFSIFLIAAFLFLVLTKFSETYTQRLLFKVQLTDLEDELVLREDSTTAIVEATVRAKGFNLLPFILTATNVLDINANTYTTKKEGVLVFDVKSHRHLLANQLGNAIDILIVKPDSLHFDYDIMASKHVPVLLNADVQYTLGFDVLDTIQLSLDSVKIVGSSLNLNAISNIKTKHLRLKDVHESFTQEIPLEIPQNITVVPKTISVNGVVKRFTEGKITLPVNLINVPVDKTLNYFPKTVDIIYYVDLERFNTVDGNNFKIVADYNSLRNINQNTIDLQVVSKSTVVKSTRLSQNKVEFIILK